MSTLSRRDSLLSLLSSEQRASLLGVQAALVSNPLYLEHAAENANEECLQRLSGEQDGNAEGTYGESQ